MSKDIEKLLKEDIENTPIGDYDSLIKKCRASSPDGDATLLLNNGNTVTKSNKKSFIIVMAIALSLLLIGIGIYMSLNKESAPTYKNRFVIVDINPSIEIEYDESNTVVSVKPYNEDGEVVLDGESLSALSLDTVVNKIFEKCVRLGYINVERDDNAVLVSVVDENGNKNESETESVKNKFATEFSQKKILGVVITGASDPSLESEASRYNIDTQKYAYIKSYLDMGGELDSQRYEHISIRELRSLIYDKEKEIKENAKKELEGLVNQGREHIENGSLIVIDATKTFINGRILVLELVGGNDEYISQYKALLDELKSLKNDDFNSYTRALNDILEKVKNVENKELEIFEDEASFIVDKIKDEASRLDDLDRLNKTPSQKAEEMLEKAPNKEFGNAEDVEGWQSEKENELGKSWFDSFNKWQENVHGKSPNQNTNDAHTPNDEQVPNENEVPNNEQVPSENEAPNKKPKDNKEQENKPSKDNDSVPSPRTIFKTRTNE